MIARSFLMLSLITGTLFIDIEKVNAQSKTAEELKTEREALKSELKSKDAEDRKKKFDKLKDPGTCGITSIDELALKSAQMLVSAKETNALIPEMYKRTIGETIDGVTDVTVKKPTLQELTELGTTIALQVEAVAASQKAVSGASEDVKSASPMQAPKATKVLNFTKDVIALVGPELSLSQKVVQHLITTVKSNKNY